MFKRSKSKFDPENFDMPFTVHGNLGYKYMALFSRDNRFSCGLYFYLRIKMQNRVFAKRRLCFSCLNIILMNCTRIKMIHFSPSN